MPEQPLISVIMAVYNGEEYLGEAIASVLNQTLQDFEFIIINDGSTDNTAAILDHYLQTDNRIRVVTQTHQGLPRTRSLGCRLAQGRYIAWADADDICLPERLAKQIGFMETQPAVGVCGTWVETIGEHAGRVWRYPTDDATIRCSLLFESVLANPSVIMRQDLFPIIGLYDTSYASAEDYDIWVRASAHCTLANLPQVLVLYRLHRAQVTQLARDLTLSNAGRVRLAQLERLGLQPNAEEFAFHEVLCAGPFQATDEFIARTHTWLSKLQAANQRQGLYPEPAFSNVLGKRWFLVCRAAISLGWQAWHTFWQSPLGKKANLRLETKIKFGLLCGVRYGRQGT